MKTLPEYILQVVRLSPNPAEGMKIQAIDTAILRRKEHPTYGMDELYNAVQGLLAQGKLQRSRWGWMRIPSDLPLPPHKSKRKPVYVPRILLHKVPGLKPVDPPNGVKSPCDLRRERILKILEEAGPNGLHRRMIRIALQDQKQQDVYTSIEWLISVGLVQVVGWKMLALTKTEETPAAEPVAETVTEPTAVVEVAVAPSPVAPSPPPPIPRKKSLKKPSRNAPLTHQIREEAGNVNLIGRVFRALTQSKVGHPMHYLTQLSGMHTFKGRLDATREAVERLVFEGLIERAPSKFYRVVEGKKWEDLTEEAYRAMGDPCHLILTAMTEMKVAATIDDIARKIDGMESYSSATWKKLSATLPWLVDTGRVVRYDRGVYGLPGVEVPPQAPTTKKLAPAGGLRRLILKALRRTHEPMALKDIVVAIDGKTNHKNKETLRIAVSGDLAILVKTRQVLRVGIGIYVPRQVKGVKNAKDQSMLA